MRTLKQIKREENVNGLQAIDIQYREAKSELAASNCSGTVLDPWFLWGQRSLSLVEKIKLLCGWKLYVRFDAPSGQCSAACTFRHQITRDKYEEVKWPNCDSTTET